MKRLHIFAAGRRTTNGGDTLEFSAADLVASAQAYDPAKHEAPIVVGHPKLDAPAHGWVASLAADQGNLFAVPQQLQPQFAEDVTAGRYKKISAAFYPPDHAANPVPGVYYLRHVGFLGAHPPAVKGLSPVEFADDGKDLVEIEFGEWTDGHLGRALRNLREWFIGKFGLEEADRALPGWTADALIESAATPDTSSPHAAFNEGGSTPAVQEPPVMTLTPEQVAAAEKKRADEAAAREAEFAEREAKLKEREAKAAEADARAARAEAVEFAEQLVKQGRLPAAQQARTVELLHAVGVTVDEITFAEGDATVKTTPAKALRDLLSALPVSIEFGEVSGSDKPEGADTGNAEALAQAAVEFVEAQKANGRIISVAQAMDHVTAQAKR